MAIAMEAIQKGVAIRLEAEKRNELVADGMAKVAEAAKFLGLAKSTVYGLMDSGELPSVRIGGSRRIPKRALIDLAAKSLEGVA